MTRLVFNLSFSVREFLFFIAADSNSMCCFFYYLVIHFCAHLGVSLPRILLVVPVCKASGDASGRIQHITSCLKVVLSVCISTSPTAAHLTIYYAHSLFYLRSLVLSYIVRHSSVLSMWRIFHPLWWFVFGSALWPWYKIFAFQTRNCQLSVHWHCIKYTVSDD